MCGIRRRGTRFISRDLRSSDGRLVRLSAIGWPGGAPGSPPARSGCMTGIIPGRMIVGLSCIARGPMSWLQNKFEKNFMISTVDYVFNWARKSALWPMTFGLACCAIEMIASSTARFDIARFGSEVFRPSPRQSDLMIVAGTVTLKMAPVVKRIYDQMPEPKWVMSMGACSSVGGPFNTYAVLQGVDRIVPVDVYVVGCPPRPENLFYGLLRLQDKIDKMSIAKKPTEVRLHENMVDDFKQQIRIAQANFANPEQLVQPVDNGVVAAR